MVRNNNPGNIRLIRKTDGSFSTPFVGEIRPGDIEDGSNAGFRKFDTLQNGFRAMFVLLKSGYINRGHNTINKIIPIYAPNSDNNNDTAYINYLTSATGINGDQVLSSYADLLPIVKAMAKMETGTQADQATVQSALNSIYNPIAYVAAVPQEIKDIPFYQKHKKELLIFSGVLATAILYKRYGKAIHL